MHAKPFRFRRISSYSSSPCSNGSGHARRLGAISCLRRGGGPAAFVPFLIASFGAYCAITSSYVYNDCCDIDVDSIALPNRPLPSAMLGKGEAQLWSLFLFLVAGAFSH